MRQTILYNWNFLRFFRLGLGIAIIIQAVMAKDYFFGFAGILFAGMAVFNMGCCGMGGCNTSVAPTKKDTETTKNITYEEVV